MFVIPLFAILAFKTMVFFYDTPLFLRYLQSIVKSDIGKNMYRKNGYRKKINKTLGIVNTFYKEISNVP